MNMHISSQFFRQPVQKYPKLVIIRPIGDSSGPFSEFLSVFLYSSGLHGSASLKYFLCESPSLKVGNTSLYDVGVEDHGAMKIHHHQTAQNRH
ncbi:hypothetical protein Hanom_Chr03g00250411 [Helianthus anomalus]